MYIYELSSGRQSLGEHITSPGGGSQGGWCALKGGNFQEDPEALTLGWALPKVGAAV